jgi:hypothetical protein
VLDDGQLDESYPMYDPAVSLDALPMLFLV